MDQRDQELEEIQFQSYNQGSSKQRNDNVKIVLGLLIIVCFGALFFHSSEDSSKNIEKTPGLVQNEDQKTKPVNTKTEQESKTMNKITEQSPQQSSFGQSQEKEYQDTDLNTDQSNQESEKNQGEEQENNLQKEQEEGNRQEEQKETPEKVPDEKQDQYKGLSEEHTQPITLDENQQSTDPNQYSIQKIEIMSLQKQILRLESEFQAYRDETEKRQLNRESSIQNYIDKKIQEFKKQQAIQLQMEEQKIIENIRREIENDQKSSDHSESQQSPDEPANIYDQEKSEKVDQYEQTVDNTSENNVQNTADNKPDNTADNIYENIADNIADNTGNNVDENTEEKLDEPTDDNQNDIPEKQGKDLQGKKQSSLTTVWSLESSEIPVPVKISEEKENQAKIPAQDHNTEQRNSQNQQNKPVLTNDNVNPAIDEPTNAN